MSLANRVAELLNSSGIEALPTYTGSDRTASLTLLNSEQLSQARSLFARKGLCCSVRNANSVDLYLPEKARKKVVGVDDPEGVELDNLISSWRQFAKHSSDNGYRKAAKRIARAPYDTLSAASQIADATLQLSRKGSLLGRLAKALKWAVKKKDISAARILLSRLTQDESKGSPLKRPAKALVAEGLVSSLRDSASRYIQGLVSDQSLTKPELLKLRSVPGTHFELWRRGAPDGFPNYVYDQAWAAAVQDVFSQMKQASKRAAATWMGDESGIDDVVWDQDKSSGLLNHGFITSSNLDPVYDNDKLKEIVGSLIEYYVVDDETGSPLHPADLTAAHVKEFLGDHYPNAPAKKVMSYLDRLMNRIPRRHEDPDESKMSSKKMASRSADLKRTSISLRMGRLLRKKNSSLRDL
jgi:hypothetical protein